MKQAIALDGPLPPNSTIGIVGGGQLGRMLASSAAQLGYRTIVLEPGENCPAAQVCTRQIVAAYDDETALAELAKVSDVVTYEFENVPLSTARFLSERGTLHPPARALEVAQDRLVEKNFLQAAGISIAPFRAVSSVSELQEALLDFRSGVLKTRRFGYDGKGQHVFRHGEGQSPVDFDSVWTALGKSAEHGCVLESFVNFNFEFSVIGARSVDGDIRTYSPSVNEHENGILRRSTVPASVLSKDQHKKAVDGVERILSQLKYVGVIGVEFFATQEGLMVNEIAPRVHNTGHWTVEACVTSQFEQHIRAVSQLPLGSVEMLAPGCVMENLLGHEADDSTKILSHPDNQLTLYGKAEAREGRKMGHVTRLMR